MSQVMILMDRRTNKRYVLDEYITQESGKTLKHCLIPMDKGEDKFVASSTIKRWYTIAEYADVVIEVKAFTGMKIGMFKARKNNDGLLEVWTKNNQLMTFDVKTDKQVNAKNPKFANKIGRAYGWPHLIYG